MKSIKKSIFPLSYVALTLLLLLISTVRPLMANVYELHSEDERLIGVPKVHKVVKGDSFQRLAQIYNVGFSGLVVANPKYDPTALKVGTEVIIPNEMILPFISPEGIVINLPELRLYYFSPTQKKVHVFPVGIGRQGLATPLTSSVISEKRKDPIWRPTKDTQQRHFEQYGSYLPKEVKAGPSNPFGKYALRLGTSEYLIHGTNKPMSIGKRASSGCIRMYDDDIKWLFDNIPLQTRVRVINQPVKMSYESGNKQLIEIHQPLSDLSDADNNAILSKAVQRFVGTKREHWRQLLPVIENPHGLVVELIN